MMHRTPIRIHLCAIVAVLAAATIGGAGTVSDYFDYGETTQVLDDVGGTGNGWATEWVWNDTSGPDYAWPVGQLSFTNTHYDDSDNPPSSGGVAHGTGHNLHLSMRSFTTAMTGTVWISLLYKSDNRLLLWLNPSVNFQNGFGVYDGDAWVRLANSTSQTALAPAPTSGETYLMLARVTVNNPGNDAIDMWIKSSSDDISSIVALGTPDQSKSGANPFGAAGLNEIGISFNSVDPQYMDALQISDDENAFEQVTKVTPPAGTIVLVR